MPQSLFVLEALLVIIAVSVPLWAFFWGGRAERASALIFASATVTSKLVPLLIEPRHAGTIFLTIDGIMALGFLTLALVYHHLWIALMMFTMAGFFSIHAYYEMTGRDLDPTFAILSNLATIFLLASLALGVWTCRRRTAQGA
jgi:hypothetical protein